ncbi:MAG TPA: helix-turn-helix transcriptional regulator [Candidatus Blautia excrementipullorum]|nr:helix-turn-helix transcriptional regulator [Candidatus Blautia excrementipullorum]
MVYHREGIIGDYDDFDDLEELIGVRRETIVHLENGRYNPSLKMAMDIAKVFHVTVEEIFEFVD